MAKMFAVAGKQLLFGWKYWKRHKAELKETEKQIPHCCSEKSTQVRDVLADIYLMER